MSSGLGTNWSVSLLCSHTQRPSVGPPSNPLSSISHPRLIKAVGILNTVSNALCQGRDPTNAVCKNHGLTLHRGLYFLVATSVNLTATVLICIRLLRTHRRMKKALVSNSSFTVDAAPAGTTTVATERVGESVVPYTRVATVLIESALPFTVLGIATAIVAFFHTTTAHYIRIFAAQLWTMASVSLMHHLSPFRLVDQWIGVQALTAQVIIHRVMTGTSWTSSREGDTYELSRSINFVHSGPPSSSKSSGIQNDVP
jgi:hypothetical protein